MKLSVVATMYLSAPHLLEFHHRASEAARKLVGDDYEIVLVNDGSPDNSLAIARELVARDAHVVVVDLSRNFGHHKAMMTGLAHARGEQIFLIDSDLEEDPEWLLDFAQILARRSSDVVYGVQDTRKGNWFERTSGRLFYWLLNRLSGDDLPQNVVTARLMTRRYVDALLLHREREIFIVGLWHLTGFDQVAEIVTKKSSSQTSYTLSKKLSLMVNAITAFSNAPLVWVFNIGAIISATALLYTLYLVANWLLFTTPLLGWTSVMASIWLVGGMIICFIGVVGIYLSKIFSEIKQRPYTIVRDIHKHEQGS
ncbi:glycosyltransferase family 2 protein [Pseudomonas denitrificans (nom. rej.)]|nr:glycosyltransferase family 2 protein [Pseudomonas denitrificans (nom. rej.)]